MAFVRIYADAQGRSKFEEMATPYEPSDPAQPGSFDQKATSVTFRSQPVGLVQDWHTAPRRQYVITLRGMAEIETGNGGDSPFWPRRRSSCRRLDGRGTRYPRHRNGDPPIRHHTPRGLGGSGD